MMNEIKTGQVKLTTSNHGNIVDEAEMLLLPKAKLTLIYDEQNKNIKMNVADTDILTDNLNGILDYSTIDDFIKVLSRMRNQIKED